MDGLFRHARLPQGAVLLELIVASVAATAVLTALISSSLAIRRSIVGTDQFAVSSANETRLIDYVARDLRRAVRVGMLYGATNTTMKNFSNFSINETNTLTINVPDYYAANTPNNAAGSTFKTTRYPRATLNTGATYNGIVPWAEATALSNGKYVTRFAPVSCGSGEIEVRYYRGPRSAGGPVCFFRAEYPSGATSPSQTREIAERVVDELSTTSLFVTGKNDGLIFQLQSNFKPRYRSRGETTVGTEAFAEVTLRNPRRD